MSFCMDAGLKYDGNSGKWVLFHFIYDVSAANQQKWYESHKALDPTHDYRISLDCSKSEGWTTLSAYDLTEGREADSVTFQARYAKKDGSNVSFYQDFAIDMPDDLMRDPDGNIYEVDSAISDEDVYKRQGFTFNLENPQELNILFIVARTAGIFLLWCLAATGVSSMLDGEGGLRRIAVVSAYALVPMVMAQFTYVLLSNVAIYDEGVLLKALLLIGELWSGWLLFLSLIHI